MNKTLNKIKQAIKNQDNLQIKEFIQDTVLRNKYWQSMMTVLILENDIKHIKNLLLKKIDINIPNKHKWTPLVIASRHGKIEIMELFLANGADIHFSNDSALYESVHLGRVDSVSFLVKNWANYKKLYKSLIKCAEVHRNRNGILDYLLQNPPN